MSGALLHALVVKLGFVVNIDLNNDSFQSNDEDGFGVTGSFRVDNDGGWVYTGDIFGNNENGTWGTPTGAGQGDPYHCRLVQTAGPAQWSSGTALNTWVALTSNRNYNFSKSPSGGPDDTIGTYRLDISDDGGSTTLASSNAFTIRLFEQSP